MNTDYERIERAIRFIRQNVDAQPDLKSVAEHIGLSSWHFQRLFQRWAGVTPKRFLAYLTVERAKGLLQESLSILDTSLESGLSGPGRLHDQFVSIEAVSPGEFKNRGAKLKITYAYHATPFGQALLAHTTRGILALAFVDKTARATELARLKTQWCHAEFISDKNAGKKLISHLFDNASLDRQILRLTVQGTNFQVKVWNALLRIPVGSAVAYKTIAENLAQPRAVRAVANAIAANPVAYLIPCHRVLRSNGDLGGYRWGVERKRLMLGREWINSGA